MKTQLRNAAHYVLAVTALIVCSGQSAIANSRILDGTNVPAGNYPAVAALSIQPGFVCTGTLVAGEYILTAAHCVTDSSTGAVVAPSAVSATLAAGTFTVSEVNVHPTYSHSGGACQAGKIDAAVLKLSSAVGGVTPIELIDSAPSVGDALTLVGYGTQGTGAGGEDNTFPATGTVNEGSTTIETITDDYVEWIFNANEANTGGGDSGGPAFVMDNGKMKINSITCGGTGNAGFNTSSQNTRADKISAWVLSITGNAPTGQAPAIIGDFNVSATVGTAFSYTVQTTGTAPITVSVTGNPSWLSLSGSTLSGTPDKKGDVSVTLSADNATGTAQQILKINVVKHEPSVDIDKAKVDLNPTDSTEKDCVTVNGDVAVGRGFNPRKREIEVEIGDLYQLFTLNKNGRGRAETGSERDTFRLIGKRNKRKRFKKDIVKFRAKLCDTDLSDDLDDLGFYETENGSDDLTLPFYLNVDGVEEYDYIEVDYDETNDYWSGTDFE